MATEKEFAGVPDEKEKKKLDGTNRDNFFV